MRKAILIAVGSELLRFGRRDTNTEWLADRLQRHGVEVAERSCVEDDAIAIGALVRGARSRAGVTIVTGGIGPTEDDRTRQAVALALDRPLARDPERVAELRAAFEARGYAYREIQSRQADRPSGSEWIRNPLGTAPGFLVEDADGLLAVLPGVPAEMRAMFAETVLPRIPPGRSLVSRVLRVGGRSESWVEARVRDLYDAPGAEVTILSGSEGIELHLRAYEAEGDGGPEIIEALEGRLLERLGEEVYGRDDQTLAAVVGARLLELGRTVATAESCTGGLLAAALTSEPGSSGWFPGGLVSYANELKLGWLGIERSTLERHGAVSEPVARAMARAVRDRTEADYGIGVTGVAGPGGGTAEKPVGTVHLALAGADQVEHRHLRLIGDRELIRRRTVTAALDLLRRRLGGAAER